MNRLSIKFSTKTLSLCLIVLMFIAHARFLYMIAVPFDRRIIQSICAILAFVIYVPGLIHPIRPINLIVGSFLSLSLIQFYVSTLRYDESLITVFKLLLEYGVIFSVFPIVWYALENGIETIENIIIVIGTIVATLLVIEGLLLYPMGRSLLEINFGVRLGGIRYINTTEPIIFAAIFSLSMLLKNRYKMLPRIMYIYSIIICITELVLVSKTRATLIMLFITIIFIVWVRGYVTQGNVTVKRILILIGLVIFVVWVMNSSMFSVYFSDYLQAQNTQYDTIAIRANETSYALEMLQDNVFNTLFGTGFVSENISHLSYQGTPLKGVRTDLGVIGFVNEFGLLGAIWFLGILIYATKTFITSIRLQKNALDLVAVYIIFILGLPTLFLFNGERLPYFPLFISIVIFYDMEFNVKNKAGVVQEES